MQWILNPGTFNNKPKHFHKMTSVAYCNSPRTISVLYNRKLLVILREASDCIMHTQVLNILQGSEF